MEDDYEDELPEEGLPQGGDSVMGKGILLLPHRRLHPHSQLIKPRPLADQEPRVSALPAHGAHGQPGGGQDHGDWTYEEQFRQVGLSALEVSDALSLCRGGGVFF